MSEKSLLNGIPVIEKIDGKVVRRGKCAACNKESLCFDGVVCPLCEQKGIKWAAIQALKEEESLTKNSG